MEGKLWTITISLLYVSSECDHSRAHTHTHTQQLSSFDSLIHSKRC